MVTFSLPRASWSRLVWGCGAGPSVVPHGLLGLRLRPSAPTAFVARLLMASPDPLVPSHLTVGRAPRCVARATLQDDPDAVYREIWDRGWMRPVQIIAAETGQSVEPRLTLLTNLRRGHPRQ
jgi:hypothetical protein